MVISNYSDRVMLTFSVVSGVDTVVEPYSATLWMHSRSKTLVENAEGLCTPTYGATLNAGRCAPSSSPPLPMVT
jgi:hypothetical protein